MGFSLSKTKRNIEDYTHYWRGVPKVGKALKNNTRVMTPTGYVRIKDLKVGDKVCTTYGGYAKVEGVYPQGKCECYEVLVAEKIVIASADHLWTVLDDEDGLEKTLTTQEIFNLQEKGKQFTLIPVHRVDMEERDPLSFEGNYGYGIDLIFGENRGDFYRDNILKNKTDSYYIPEEQVFNSFKNRLDLLAGIWAHAEVDEWGVTQRFPENEYDEKFFSTMRTLARSLGMDVFELEKDKYILCFLEGCLFKDTLLDYMEDLMFTKAQIAALEDSDTTDGIEVLRKTDKKYKCTCIQVDSLDSLFLIEGCIPTHNTTLFRDLVQELYDDPTKGLLINVGSEEGTLSIENLFTETAYEWSKREDEDGNRGFIQIVDDLIKNKDEYGIKLVAIDTYDQLIGLVEKYIIERESINNGVEYKSLNQVGGGYGRGKKMALETIQEVKDKLRRAGYGLVFISHTKIKTMTDEETGLEYRQITSNLTSDYDSLIGNEAQIIMVATVDKDIDDGVLVGTERNMHFRDNGMVDSGSRFLDMPDKLPIGAKNYIKAFNHGVESSLGKLPTEQKAEPKTPTKAQIKKLGETIKQALSDEQMTTGNVEEICKKNNIKKISEIKDMETFESVMKDVTAFAKGEDVE